MGTIEQNILKEVAGLDALPVGAYNIRTNGTSSARNTTANIDIVTKEDKPGIDIIIKPGTRNIQFHLFSPPFFTKTAITVILYESIP